MMLELATRNLRRGAWRTALAATALALATALLVVTLALIEGLFTGLVRGVTRRADGDALLVRAAAPVATRPEPIADVEALCSALRRLPAVAAAAPRLRIQGLLLAGERRAAAEVVGIDPAAEDAVTDLQRLLVAGGPLRETGGGDALLGRLLASRLDVRAGGRITLITRAPDGLPISETFRVAGIIATGDPRRDGTLALAGIDRVASLLDLPGAAHEIGIALLPGADARHSAEAITAALPPGSGLVAIPWQARFPALADAVRFSRASSWWLIALFHAAAGLVTLIVLVLGAHERRREHAVCLALGVPAALLRRVIAAEALVLGAASVAAGSLIGAAIVFPLGTHGVDLSRFLAPVGYAGGTILPVLHAALRADDLVRTGAVLLGVCALAGWLSGRRIARLEPARVIAGRDEG
jgi:ABC-type lipoprotein release transport system permease subunit